MEDVDTNEKWMQSYQYSNQWITVDSTISIDLELINITNEAKLHEA